MSIIERNEWSADLRQAHQLCDKALEFKANGVATAEVLSDAHILINTAQALRFGEITVEAAKAIRVGAASTWASR